MPFGQFAHLEEGMPHADAERLGLVRARDDAAVVVRQHDDGAPLQLGAEDPFARSEEVVAVAESVHLSVVAFGLCFLLKAASRLPGEPAASDLFYGVGHHAPDREVSVAADLDLFVALVGGDEDDLALSQPHPLERELPVEETHRHAAVVHLQRLVDHHQVAVGDAVVLHAVARDPGEERRRGVAHQRAVQVEGRLEVVVGRRGETRRDAARGYLELGLGRGVG